MSACNIYCYLNSSAVSTVHPDATTMKEGMLPISFDRIAELIRPNDNAPPENHEAFELERRSVLIERVLTDVAFRLLHEIGCPHTRAELAPWHSEVQSGGDGGLFRGCWDSLLQQSNTVPSNLQRALQARSDRVARLHAGADHDGPSGDLSNDRDDWRKRKSPDGDRSPQ